MRYVVCLLVVCVLVLLVYGVHGFFFFKQKTAYEMRISDWSSDVCSYDLPPITGPADLKEHVLLQQTRRPRKWREWFEAMGVSGLDAGAGPRFEHFYMIAQAAIAHLGNGLVPRLLVEDDIASEIGGESGRERGGKYVEISGVADLVKKKK